MNNSVNQIIAYLQANPFTSENEIMNAVFGFKRIPCKNNKKYADMLRRGLHSGKIARVQAKKAGKADRFFYYIPENKVAQTDLPSYI